MRDEDERGRVFTGAEPLEKSQELLARQRIESGAWLIEDQQLRPGHEGAANQDTLAFSLGKDFPAPSREIAGLHLPEDPLCGAFILWFYTPPVVDHGVLSGDDGGERGFGLGHELSNAGRDEAHTLAKLAPIARAVGFAPSTLTSPAVGER